MNRRKPLGAKKLDFEPKIPVIEEKPQETVINAEPVRTSASVPVLKGNLAPKTFAIAKECNLAASEFFINLPSFFNDQCTLVIYNDNTVGIRMNGIVYECDSTYFGDAMVVEVDDKVKKIATPEFAINAYPYEKQ